MKTAIETAAALALSLSLTSALMLPSARAGEAGEWYVAPALNYILADDDRSADDDFGLQLGIGKQLTDAWNLEANLEADTLDFDSGGGEFKQLGAALDGLYLFNRDPAFSPFGLIGAGVLNTKVPGEKGAHPMMNAGLGFLSNAFSDTVALRGDVRYRWDKDDESVATEERFGDWVFSLGLSIPLGGGAAPAPAAETQTAAAAVTAAPGDSDGDGVPNSDDACPDSPDMSVVDARGCEPDSDDDGVADSRDRCPGTPTDVSVDTQGCAVDSDGDGVLDSADRCNATPAGAQVDIHGCEIVEIIELPGVNFGTGSARLLADSTAILDEAAATLRKHPDIKAEVAGHTDNRGARALNVKLSQQRAEAVMNYLVARGVPAANLTARGYGPDRPVADNAMKDGRAANRRVELRIVK